MTVDEALGILEQTTTSGRPSLDCSDEEAVATLRRYVERLQAERDDLQRRVLSFANAWVHDQFDDEDVQDLVDAGAIAQAEGYRATLKGTLRNYLERAFKTPEAPSDEQ